MTIIRTAQPKANPSAPSAAVLDIKLANKNDAVKVRVTAKTRHIKIAMFLFFIWLKVSGVYRRSMKGKMIAT